ncbi:ABC transporter substrate-binding protein [Microbacterium sp. SORGH_AS_0888]|uniref:ABC transporter substrate-binding protein n=1 Tax=Microbacterium sp. SORGH_AS_0888 TaxID=3041791 RepID=UPI00278A6534|nr:ABC transporter substrate-binding protein [Microbacterium sp. SORGH_AS_0888]MDQ1129875.1 ABC-type nitrate/sulfonate/bicarbonate transport system substrate-binding protein [Microbacterium sp. SORGH_AS_0888]
MSFLTSRRSRVATSVAAIALTALALTACSGGSSSGGSSASSGGDSADLGQLNVQLSWIKNEEFCGEFFADSKGYFTGAGFSGVNLIPGPSTSVSELLSGTADFGLSDAVATGSAIATEGSPLKVIGTTYQKNPFTILSLKNKGNIATVADLKGKKIGVQDSNTSLFNAFLAANGLTSSDVTVVPVQYDPAPLTNGEVDGFIAYLTNEAIIVKNEGYDTVNLPFADNGLPFPAETFIATDDMIKNHPDKVKAFLKAEIQGWTDAVNDPKGCSDLAVNDYGKDLNLTPANSLAGAEAQLSDLVVSDETVENGLFTISDELKSSTIKSLADAGINVTTDQLFDTSLLDEVYKENPDLVKYAK